LHLDSFESGYKRPTTSLFIAFSLVCKHPHQRENCRAERELNHSNQGTNQGGKSLDEREDAQNLNEVTSTTSLRPSIEEGLASLE
jgi:hypothetical protein